MSRLPHRWTILLFASGLGVVALGACAQLLGFEDPRTEHFPHRAHVTEGISCIKCHQGIEGAGETGPLHMPSNESCLTCHSPPHNAGPCDQCHTTSWTQRRAEANRQYILFRHESHIPREGAQCVRCHSGIQGKGIDLEARMSTCFGCHAHRDQFKKRRCEACHVNLPAEATPPESHLIHGDGFLSTHGVQAASSGDLCTTCHTETFCADCHGRTTGALPSHWSFDEPFTPSVHRAGFASRHALESAGNPGLCTTCHQESFCSTCHRQSGIDASAGGTLNPHPQGWVGPFSNLHGPAARRDPLSCAACHSGGGEQLCVDCHRVGGIGGSPHPPGWNSSRNLFERPCRFCHVGP